MSIENNLASIAASLATIAEVLKRDRTTDMPVAAPVAVPAPVAAAPVVAAPTPVAAPVVEPPPPRRFRLHLPARSPTSIACRVRDGKLQGNGAGQGQPDSGCAGRTGHHQHQRGDCRALPGDLLWCRSPEGAVMSDHARLSPSQRYRWRVCAGSIREANKLPKKPGSAAAIDGTHTHTLLERVHQEQDAARHAHRSRSTERP